MHCHPWRFFLSKVNKMQKWIDVKDYKPQSSEYVWVWAHDIVSNYVIKAHAYVCPEYGNIIWEEPETSEDMPIIVMQVHPWQDEQPSKPIIQTANP